MKARILKSNNIVDVTQDPENENYFYQFGEHGRLVSDYSISDLEIIEDDKIKNIIYENLWVVRNDSGRLLMFTEKPARLDHIKKWDSSINHIPLLTKFPGINLDMFNDLKWEDEPRKIRMILIDIEDDTK